MKKTIFNILIALGIIIISMIIVSILKPLLPFVPGEFWTSLEYSFGFTYIFFNPIETYKNKNDGTMDKRSTIIVYVVLSLVVALVGGGIDYLF